MSDFHMISLFPLLAALGFVIYAIWQDFPPRRGE
ncbi:photosystem ii protein y (psbY) [Caudoviricetes sp.]|nr:photosystem ii protein y (psbY) [Caudoviricetes sp.]